MSDKLTKVTEKKIIGIETHTNNQNEMNPSTAKIPGLWGKFFSEGLIKKIPNKIDPNILLGVYTNYESDHTGEYSLIASSEVSSHDSIPTRMVGSVIPSGSYLVFEAKGELPDALIKTWMHIWEFFPGNNQYKRIYTADFELYKGENEVDIYIAVEN